MMPDHRQSSRRPRRRTPQPEFGDWRVPVAKPHEVEHLEPKSLGVYRRLRVRAAYWESLAPAYGAETVEDWQPVRGMKCIVRRVIGLGLLLPLSVVMVYALLLQLYHAAPMVGELAFWQSEPVWFTVLGALVFMSLKYFRLIDPILMFFYVLGHELTHALAALLCLGKVQALCVDLDGGYVDTDKDNIFVSLAPYFVPLWMLVWLGGLFIANCICPFATYLPWFYAGFGFWWCFHVYWTLWVIPREQPDLLENGVVFSFMIIMLTNMAGLLLILRGFGVISFRGYTQDFVLAAREIGLAFADLAQWLIVLLRAI